MAMTTFEQDIFIAASPEVVREELAHVMTNVAELHPFVVWARLVRTETAPDGSKVFSIRFSCRSFAIFPACSAVFSTICSQDDRELSQFQRNPDRAPQAI